MIANAWWDRGFAKNGDLYADPDAKKFSLCRGSTKGGDSAWRMRVPAFSDELRFQKWRCHSRGHIFA